MVRGIEMEVFGVELVLLNRLVVLNLVIVVVSVLVFRLMVSGMCVVLLISIGLWLRCILMFVVLLLEWMCICCVDGSRLCSGLWVSCMVFGSGVLLLCSSVSVGLMLV